MTEYTKTQIARFARRASFNKIQKGSGEGILAGNGTVVLFVPDKKSTSYSMFSIIAFSKNPADLGCYISRWFKRMDFSMIDASYTIDNKQRSFTEGTPLHKLFGPFGYRAVLKRTVLPMTHRFQLRNVDGKPLAISRNMYKGALKSRASLYDESGTCTIPRDIIVPVEAITDCLDMRNGIVVGCSVKPNTIYLQRTRTKQFKIELCIKGFAMHYITPDLNPRRIAVLCKVLHIENVVRLPMKRIKNTR